MRTTGLPPGGDHRLVGGAGRHRIVGKAVQALEFRVAHDQAVVGVPHHERLRDGLDRVAQPHVGGLGLGDEPLLLGDVDRDADQVQAGLARLLHQLAAGPQPDPVAARMAHAEFPVDRGGGRLGELRGQLVELDVVRVHQRADLAEGQDLVLRFEPEQLEHRARPEDAARAAGPSPTGRSGRD